MAKKFRDLSQEELAKLPRVSNLPSLGEIVVHIHCYNKRKHHVYLAEYTPGFKHFFAFFESRSDGIYNAVITMDELLSYGKKGDDWDLVVDESWKPAKAKDVDILKGYISMVMTPPDY